MNFETSVPNSSRPSSNYEILFISGGPGENTAPIPFNTTKDHLSNQYHREIFLEPFRFSQCSQRQIKTTSDKEVQASVPNWSRLLMRNHSQKFAIDRSIIASDESVTNLNFIITTTSRHGSRGRHAEHFHQGS